MPDTDVLGHFETRNLVELFSGGDVAVVFAQDTGLVLGHALLGDTFVAEAGLFTGEGDCVSVLLYGRVGMDSG